MAIFKLNPIIFPPPANQRIGDSNVTFSTIAANLYGTAQYHSKKIVQYPPRPQPAARPPKLPYSAKKQRYASVNHFIANLADTYAGLSAPRKVTWDDFYDLTYYQLLCLLLDGGDDVQPPFDPGLAAFNAVNASRYDQVLPVTLDPPFDPFDPATASMTVTLTPGGPPNNPNLLNSLSATLIAGDSTPPSPLNCSLYLRTPNRISPPFTSRRKLQHVANFDLTLDSPVLLGNTLGQSQQWRPHCAGTLEFRIGYPGSVERAAFEYAFNND